MAITLAYWDGDSNVIGVDGATGTIATYLPSKIAVSGYEHFDTVDYQTYRDAYAVFIESTTGYLYAANLKTGAVAAIDAANTYVDILDDPSGQKDTYALRSNGVIYKYSRTINNGAAGAVSTSFTSYSTTGCSNPSKFCNSQSLILDTDGDLWWNNSGWTQLTSLSPIITSAVQPRDDGGGPYTYAVASDGKLYNVDLDAPSATQIGSSTNWSFVFRDDAAVNTSGVGYWDLSAPTTIGGTYGTLDDGALNVLYAGDILYRYDAYDTGDIVSVVTLAGVTAVGLTPEGTTGLNSGIALALYDPTGSSYTEDISDAVTGTDTVGATMLYTEDIADSPSGVDAAAPGLVAAQAVSDSGGSQSAITFGAGVVLPTDSAAAVEVADYEVVNWLFEAAAAAEGVSTQSLMHGSLVESVQAYTTLVQLLQELLSEAAVGADGTVAGIAVNTIEYMQAVGVAASTSSLVAALAELVATTSLLETGLLEELSEGAAAVEVATQVYQAYMQLIEAGIAADSTASYVVAYGVVAEGAATADAATAAQNLTALVEDGAAVWAHFAVGGEVYTGWVLNTMSGAVTEYQGLQFNGLARVGARYFGTMEGGLYELAGSDDAGTSIATYIKSGLMDFVDPQQRLFPDTQKRVDALYLGCSADGEVAVKVVTIEHGQVLERWYGVNAVTEGEKNTRLVLGKGLRARRWMFEIASTELDTFSAVTLYPLQTGRRI